MSAEYDVLVIGGGAAGLATSCELARAGVDAHLVVERGNEVGQTWAHFYDSLVLHTPLRLSALPGLAFPPGTPLFPRRLDYLKYLCKYAEAFAVPLRLGTGVVELRRHSNSWYARTADGAELSARAVVVATGIASQPHVPDLPGREHFEGGVLHSAEYRRPEPFTGRRVLVVGAGNSAADISVELSRAGIEVTLAVRSGATVVPLHVAGIPVQYLAVAVAPLPRGAQRALARAGAALGRPAVLPWAPIGDCSGVPVTGGHLPDALRSGAVRLKGSVTELVANGVRFADHDVLPIDTIILATGYRAAVGLLDGSVRLDSCGFPLRTDAVTSADQPDLYFVGHNRDVRGSLYRISRDARLAAAHVRSGLDGTPRTPTERQPHRYEL